MATEIRLSDGTTFTTEESLQPDDVIAYIEESGGSRFVELKSAVQDAYLVNPSQIVWLRQAR
jgi:hypothetical protein